MRYSRLTPALFVLALGALSACDSAGYPTSAAQGSTGNGPLAITPASAQVYVDQSITLTANQANSQLEWTSLQPTVASVDGSGVVVGLSPGVATIRVRVRSDTTQQAQASVTVVQAGGGSATRMP